MKTDEIKIIVEKLMEVYKEQGRKFPKEDIKKLINYLDKLEDEKRKDNYENTL